MHKKTLGRVEIKNAEQGEIKAVFSTFDAIDHDGDVTRKEAFTDGESVRISAFNHGSWQGALPVGKGVIRVNEKEAVLDGQFFMNTDHGRSTFETVKEMGDLQEFSYGFDIVDAEPGEFEGKSVRFLKSVKVHEVSPVLIGAGVGTRTLDVKSKHDDDEEEHSRIVPAVKRAIPSHETNVVTRSWDGQKTVAAVPDDARPSELRTVYAWVDPDGDSETKSSYKFPHHHGVDGPANLRACIAGIAFLNGAGGGADIPDSDREAVYKHLADHIRDADREPPELRNAPEGEKKNLRFGDEAADVMAALSGLADRAAEIMALRAKKGRGMSPATADLLGWVTDELERLKSLLDTPIDKGENEEQHVTDDEIASTVLAALARVNDM